jgi:hypothetical protein
MHAARAYGFKPPASAVDALKFAEPGAPSQTVGRLIAGQVVHPVQFDGARTAATVGATSPAHVLQMYNRAADRVEAAVRVELGRTIDVRG